ncbi:MAG: hypothetical protein ABIT01_08685 [Thermoanaerobaculia bacterium]
MKRVKNPVDPEAPFASSWWALKWISLLESFGWASRLRKGREVARAGHVRSLEVGPSGVMALVGDAAEPAHQVRIVLKPLPDRVLSQAIQTMAGKASFAASLLSGTIPHDIDAAFTGTGRTLLPESPDELKMSCDCSDEATLCEHRAAVMYMLGERFDRDPFLIFLLRGRSREELLAALQSARSRAQGPAHEGVGRPLGARAEPMPRAPLPDVKPEFFFKPLAPVATLKTTFSPPEHPEAILTRLGPAPLGDPEAARLLSDLHRAVGLGAAERLEEWEWRRVWGRENKRPQDR